RGLLRPCRKWPSDGGAADQAKKFAPPHVFSTEAETTPTAAFTLAIRTGNCGQRNGVPRSKLHCENLEPAMSQLGHSRRIGAVRNISALPPKSRRRSGHSTTPLGATWRPERVQHKGQAAFVPAGLL